MAASKRFRCTIFRYDNVYGPRQGAQGEASVTRIFIDTLRQQKLFALYAFDNDSRGMTRDYVFVSDVAEANILALDRTMSDVFHIGSAIETHTLDLYEKFSTLSGVPMPLEFHPARLGDLARSALDFRKAQNALG